MTTIKVNEFLNTAMCVRDAEILKEKIIPYVEYGESVLLDFSGITHFTSLFFNTSLCSILFDIGKEKYDSLITVLNLPDYAKNSYEDCYEETIDNPFDGLNKYELRELGYKLLNIDEEDN
ncbi:STAS-like domain-containing protein [Anaerobutyricum hallii]|uniref:STAS-like domain-containing protein n=1 Tax=Anaerobutyricum hallii TaxID=39488 RepID=UPI0026E97773|nr:STAS-like domain-containing protein [Anaerobutyricum hallii]